MKEHRTHDLDGYSRAFQALLPRLGERSSYLETCRKTAEQDLQAVLALAFTEEPSRLAQTRSEYHNPALVTRLIQQSGAELTARPERSLRLAELAFELTRQLDFSLTGEDIVRDLAIRAQSYRANALRAMGRLKEAEMVFRRVAISLADSADPILRAEVLSQLASLDKDRRHFSAAQDKLTEVFNLARRIDDQSLQARTLLQQASVHFHGGDGEQAITTVKASLSLLSANAETQLAFYAQHNLATYLCSTEHFEEARQCMESCRRGYEKYATPLIELRRLWVEGKIALGLGEVASAEPLLLQVREGFLAQNNLYDVATVSLDLVLVYLEQSRHGDIRRLATEVVEAFTALEVEREAIAAALLLQEAARREAVSRRMVKQLLARLQGGRGIGAGSHRELAPT